MAKIDTRVTVEKCSTEGRGLAYPNGHTTFITGALPQECVDIRVLRRRKKIIEAVATEVVECPHPDRVVAPCPHFLACGGCGLQHMAVTPQILMKQARFEQMWLQAGLPAPKVWAKPLCGPDLGYRRSARLGLKYVHKKNKLLMGFRELDGRKVLDMHACPVLVPAIQQWLFVLQETLAKTSIQDAVPQIEVSAGDDAVAVIVRHLAPFTEHDIELLQQFMQASGWHVWLQAKGPDSVKPLEATFGLLAYTLVDQNLTLSFYPQDFIQVNANMNQQMINQAMAWLAPQASERVLDLFCGLGNFSLAIAQSGASVVGVEGSEDMTLRAAHNAAQNGLASACTFHAANLESMAHPADWAQMPYDRVLLDPPRSGAAACVKWLGERLPKRIVYVSCHAATLVRDAEVLIRAGYRAQHAGVMDMFPHTHHVEAMVCFDLEV